MTVARDTAITTRLNEATARQAIAEIVAAHKLTIESGKLTIESGQRCQCLVAMFFDCHGPAALGIHSPDKYLASALGVSRQHVHRLRQAGRVLLVLSPTGDIELNERRSRSLAKLLDRPDDLRSAYDAALADASASDVPVSYHHIAAAVKKCLPPVLPPDTLSNRNPKSRPTPTNGWIYDLSMAAAHWVDLLNEHPSAPQELRQATEHVKTLAWNYHLEQDHEPDKLPFSTT